MNGREREKRQKTKTRRDKKEKKVNGREREATEQGAPWEQPSIKRRSDCRRRLPGEESSRSAVPPREIINRKLRRVLFSKKKSPRGGGNIFDNQVPFFVIL